MTDETKSRLVNAFYILGAIGLLDMAVQMASNHEVEIVKSVLGWVLGK